MLAGLPEEVRNKVMSRICESYDLEEGYEEVYDIEKFRSNPYPDDTLHPYGRCLSEFTVADIIIILDELMQERQDG